MVYEYCTSAAFATVPIQYNSIPFIAWHHHCIVATLHFMPDTARIVQDRTTLDDTTLRMGADRIRAALAGVYPGTDTYRMWCADKPIGGAILDDTYVEPEGTASFLAASLICAKAAEPKLTGRFAYTEALYAIHTIHHTIGQRQTSTIPDVCRAVLGMAPGRYNTSYTIPIPQYLGLATGLGRTWKLIHRRVHAGHVWVEPDVLLRLLRDAITAYIRARIIRMYGLWSSDATPHPPLRVVSVPPDIQGWCAEHADANISAGDTPPCVKHCIQQMSEGVNLSHAGRFLVAAFFIHGGSSNETISGFFTGAPDYAEHITLQQIEQIRRRRYSIPGCRWVESHRLCPGCDAPHPSKYVKP